MRIDRQGVMSDGKRVAVMQPYFYPYAGYFRLFAAADELVLYDCVQFPRRGRVHRCRVPAPNGGERWLTLPLRRQPRETAIHDLGFADGAREELDRRLARLPWIAVARGPQADRVRAHLEGPLDDVVGFLETGLRLVRDLLGFHTVLGRSSQLGLDPALRGQERVLAVCEAVGATTYLNPPGGRHLYSPEAFSARGIRLDFLPEYRGRLFHLLPALLAVPADEIRADVLEQCPKPCDDAPRPFVPKAPP
jgi:hypothetical protein